MDTKALDGLLVEIQGQRELFMDRCAQMASDLSVKNDQIEKLTAEVADLTAKLAAKADENGPSP